MKFKNGNSRLPITIAAAAACTVAFTGCVPLTPTPKFALYYQVSQSPGTQKSWIKRWVPETNKTETIFQQQTDGSGINTEFLWSLQPNGSILTLFKFGLPAQSWSVLVPDSPNPKARLLYTSTPIDDAHLSGGIWNQWAPDGKHIGLQIDDNIVIVSPDNNIRATVGKIDGVENLVNVGHAWSPDGSAIAYTRSDTITEISTVLGGKTDFSISGDDGSHFTYADPRWFADNRHLAVFVDDNTDSANGGRIVIFDKKNPTVSQLGFTHASPSQFFVHGNFSPDNDRTVETVNNPDNSASSEILVFADNRANVTLSSTAEDGSGIQPLSSWSHDGKRLAYIKDVDNDGNADVVIASKDGVVQKTFTNFGPGVASLSWSPNDAKLIVNTTPATDGSTESRLITLWGGAINTLPTTAAASAVDWSPNSRYAVVGGSLLDTTLTTKAATPLPAYYQIAWAFDSSYLAISTQQESACTASVIKLSDSNRTITPVAQNTSCSVFWSNPAQ